MKRWIATILMVTLVLGSVLEGTGCDTKDVVILTRGQWVEKLAKAMELDNCEVTEPVFADVKEDNSYYNAVQNCAAWDILDKSKNFDPDEEATINYAITTAVRAIGIDKIAKSTQKKNLQTEDDMMDYFSGISDIDYISGGALYEEWADKVINDMKKAISSLELEQYQDIGLTENCVEVGASDVMFSADGKTGTLKNKSINVQTGTILVINPSEIYPNGKTAKITAIKGEKFEYVEPSMEEVVEHVVLTGTYEPQIIGVIPMSDKVSVETIGGDEAVAQKCDPSLVQGRDIMYVPKDTDSKKLEVTKSHKDIVFSLAEASGKSGAASGSASAKIGIKDITATADIDLSFLTVKRAYAKVNSTLFADFNASGSYLPDAIPLGSAIFNIYGIVNLKFDLTLSVGASGELAINWSLPTTLGVDYEKGAGSKFIKETPGSNLTAEAHAEAYISPGIKGTFEVLGFDVASCGVYSGVTVNIDAKADAKKAKYCLNLKAHVPLSCFAGGEGKDTLLGKLGIEKSWTIWDANSSKIKKEFHIENNKVVPDCTMEDKKDDSEKEEINYEQIKMPPMPKIDFSAIESNFFGITEAYVSMEENSEDKLPINAPKGYSEKDIVCTSNNETIASVTNNGVISGNSAGVTQIKVATKDGKYAQYISVRVIGDYSVDFTPLSVKVNRVKGYSMAC